MTNPHDSTDAQREQPYLISGSVASSLAVACCSMTDFPDLSLIDQVLHDKSGEPARIAARCEQTLATTSELAGHLVSFVQAGFQLFGKDRAIRIAGDVVRRESDQREDRLRRAGLHPDKLDRLKYTWRQLMER